MITLTNHAMTFNRLIFNTGIDYLSSFCGKHVFEDGSRLGRKNVPVSKWKAPQGTNCSESEIEGAKQITQIHNLVEEVAYKAFADAVVENNITEDRITEEQSSNILFKIKQEAHKLMYSKDGYIAQRSKLLNPSQVKDVITNVGRIIHDRDTKLTDARYHTLSELLMALDDHNTMVKEILLGSWYKEPNFSDKKHEHLNKIKSNVNFYATVNAKLSFNLQEALESRKTFWDVYFPSLREATKQQEEDTSRNFINVHEVRSIFLGFKISNIDALLGEHSGTQLNTFLSNDQYNALFEPKECNNLVRRCSVRRGQLLSDNKITIGEFFKKYFPEYTP